MIEILLRLLFAHIIADFFLQTEFLLAAKSVFRFDDLNKANNIQVTEYVLIGTLTSFAIAIMTGIIIKQL